jgi:hypothetical protein
MFATLSVPFWYGIPKPASNCEYETTCVLILPFANLFPCLHVCIHAHIVLSDLVAFAHPSFAHVLHQLHRTISLRAYNKRANTRINAPIRELKSVHGAWRHTHSQTVVMQTVHIHAHSRFTSFRLESLLSSTACCSLSLCLAASIFLCAAPANTENFLRSTAACAFALVSICQNMCKSAKPRRHLHMCVCVGHQFFIISCLWIIKYHASTCMHA